MNAPPVDDGADGCGTGSDGGEEAAGGELTGDAAGDVGVNELVDLDAPLGGGEVATVLGDAGMH